MMDNRYTRRYNGDVALEWLFDESFLENALHSKGNEMEILEDDANILNSTVVIDFNINDDDLPTIDIKVLFTPAESM